MIVHRQRSRLTPVVQIRRGGHEPLAGQPVGLVAQVLLGAAVLTLATGDWTDASVILLVIVVNTAAGVIQETRPTMPSRR